MIALLGIVLAIVIVAVIVTPFSRRTDRRLSHYAAEDRNGTENEEVSRIYGEIRTIKSELDAGNLTASEFEQQLGELRLAAARALRNQDRQRMRDIEAELMIEREVRNARSRVQAHRDDSE